jgi:uncharacterized protein YndB with AHSA1/START domain
MAEKGSSPAKDSSDREIVITRVFDAPRELIWDAWTDPKQVVQWWGPKGFSTTIHEMDVRPGGVWRHVMHGPDGSDYPNLSTFLEVVKPERIVYSHGGGRKGDPGAQFEATWTFEAEGNKTRLTLRMVFPSAAARDLVVKTYNAIEGGNQTLGRLGEQLAKTPVIIERTFNASAETVWKAITNVNDMKQWWPHLAPLESFKAEVGFETQFNIRNNEKDFLHIWKVTEVVPGKKITYDWKFGGNPGKSSVTFELSAEGKKTKLKLTHKGLETFLPESNPDLARGNFLMGWTSVASSLGEFVEKSKKAAIKELVITRILDAPRELVFEAWTGPKHMAQWFGPRKFTTPVCELDPRPGGAILIHMRGPDGTVYPMTGVYHEVVRPERLVYMSWVPNKEKPLFEILTTVTFAEQGGKTKLTMHAKVLKSTPEAAPMLAGMEEGWKQTLDRLGEHVGGG